MAEPTERELFCALMDHLVGARDSMRGLALCRNDERWIAVARIMDEVKDKTSKLMTKAPRGMDKTRIWMPGQPYNGH